MPDLHLSRASAPAASHSGAEYLIRHTTLRQLQLFDAIVRHGSFTRAAEELFLTQPTVSMQVKKLADTLGTPLLQHNGRLIEPTDAGRAVHQACRVILNHLATLDTQLADLHALRRGRLRLGVMTTAAYVAPEILGAFCAKYPGLEVALNVTNRDQLLERLTAQDDDLYVMGQPDESLLHDITATPFAPNPLVMVARSDHPLARERSIPLARLAEENLLLREPGSGVRAAVLKHFTAAGVTPNVRMQLGSTETIKHAIVGGLGISALSLHSLRLESSGGKLALLDVVGFPIIRRWHLVYSRGRDLSLAAKTFLDFAVASEPEIRGQLGEAMTAFERLRSSV
ncbi:LysR family transcriptional regulator [Rhodoferax sp. 4810]|uniref:LysR family transcriptional regulator n=1 Tax=Thiospirillum jenense TaxID=1653858 RepID=A0A839H4A4_9GAMM|nr:LysR family transcriptional regulator [Thiospirillum jenense]MBB1073225.1 LysR family transcriptional regulator [Rhodoferax jenense]MBB1124614.1 LysR family transcriptional regulator [Thiospirillum jenense]